MILLLLALQGAALPTVGDTIWVTRTVRVPAGDSVRPAAWSLEGPVQVLGKAEVVLARDAARIRYPMVAWEPGTHHVEVPGPVLVSPSGMEDSLRSESVTLVVRSVLPADRPDTALPVQPPAGLVPRPVVSALPVVILSGLAVLLLIPVHWYWRRRGPRVEVPPPPVEREPLDDTVRRWLEAGERRAVAGVAMDRLRQVVAASVPEAGEGLDLETCLAVVEQARPSWPLDELRRVLTGLDTVRYAPDSRDGVQDLYHAAVRLEAGLGGRTG
ncbi:MAG: hypothetical protein AB7I33_03535 [Gemmatimonadales bacterium]